MIPGECEPSDSKIKSYLWLSADHLLLQQLDFVSCSTVDRIHSDAQVTLVWLMKKQVIVVIKKTPNSAILSASTTKVDVL